MKNRPDKSNDDKQHEELRQQLWELAYGLLEPHEETALIERVKSDPALARLYAEVKLQTDLVSTAARVEDSSLSISAVGAGVGSSVGVNKEKRTASKSSSRSVPAAKATNGSFGTNWLAVVGTTALLLLLGYGLWQPTVVTNSVAQGEYYYTRVTGLAAMTEGVTQKVGVEYKDIHNNGRATELAVRLVDQQGHETYRTTVNTSADGRGEVDLPGSVLKKGVRLKVAPADSRSEGHRESEVVSAELQVADEKKITVMLTERPYAEPGESNRFQMFGVGEYTKSITPPATDELMVEKESGGDVVQPMWTVDPSNGVINGEYKLPKTYSADDGLAMRRRSLEKSREKPQEQAKQQAGPQATYGSGPQLAGGGSLGGGAGGGLESAAKSNEEARPLDRAGGTLRQADANARESLELQRGVNSIAKAGPNKTGRAKPGNADQDEVPAEGGRGAAFGAARPGMMRSTGPAGAAASPPAPPAAAAPTATEAPPAPAAPAPGVGISPQNFAPAALPEGSGNRKNAASAPAPGSAVLRPSDKPQTDAAPPQPGSAPAVNAPAPFAPAQQGEAKPGESPTKESLPKESQQQKDQQFAKQEKSPGPASDPTGPLRSEVETLAIGAEAKRASDARKAAESLQEFEVVVPDQVRGEELVLVARDADGRVVAWRELGAYKEAEAKVKLPPEVNGLVDVQLYRKDQPGNAVLRQQLVRTSSRSLQLEVSGLKDAYAPGEKVQLSIRVVDEHGHPAAGLASVRVWNDVAARAASSPLLLVDSLSQDGLTSDAAKREAPLALAANGLAANVPTAAAPTSGAPAFSEQDRAGAAERKVAPETGKDEPHAKGIPSSEVPAMSPAPPATQAASEVFFVDNHTAVQQEYDRAVAIQEMHRSERLQSFGRVLMWSGAGLMLLVGVLLVARRPLKSAVWIPAVGLAALSLGLGVAWFLPQSQPAMQLARALPAEVEKTSGTLPEKPAGDPAVKSAPAALPVPGDAPVVQIAPEAPANQASPPKAELLKQLAERAKSDAPTDPTAGPVAPGENAPNPAGFNGGRGQGGYGSNADRNSSADKKGNVREGEQLAEKRQDEPKPKAGVEASGGGQPDVKKSDGSAANRDQVAESLRNDQSPPDSLFWRPLSPIERDGTFTIEFTMPAAESDYRLLIDAIGSGRIGGKEQLLRCRAE